MRLIGILLIVFGIVALITGGIRYTKRDKIIDAGPIQATRETTKTVPLTPLVGIVAVVGGIALVYADRRHV